ncbi:MAG: VCBS repeat-containing protein [Akkermansiaceae bacterium]|nr:VCBS repeat-containing protein [Akkermansiaceae bacterium]
MKPTPLILLAFAPLAHAGFRAQTIDDKVTIGYGLAVADVDGDGKDDILLVDAAQTVWYKNPTWEKHTLTGKLTPKDHVCVCAKDIDGDGKAEVAVGAEWAPNDTKDSGAVFALFPGEDRTKPWKEKALHREPTTHRMHWVLEKPGVNFLAVLPLHGCDNVKGEGPGIKFLGYRPEKDPAKDWATFLLHEGFHMAHNFDPVMWPGNEEGESLLVACKEGTHLLQQRDGKWNATRMTEKGSGEVRTGKLPGGKRFIATIEPMHGNEVVINPENAEGKLWSENRIVLDDTLAQGHALAAADFLGLGHDQVVAGWREPAKDTKKVGIRLYAPNADGTEWKLHSLVDDNAMACEDIKAADLNGDGKPDLIASGRATKNLIIYWNE